MNNGTGKAKRDSNANRKRNVNFLIKTTQEERDMIDRRMKQTGMTSLRGYILKMAIDGRVIHVELESIKKMVRLLSSATSNINQVAKKCNETGNLYARDVEVLRERVEGIWGQTQVILQKLAKL